jgi:formylglycine-generating enzyme required for sulfatase activity/serine/threonine protein kinase
MPPSADPSRPSADVLFASWLARHEAGEESDFEALCQEHPDAAARLRELLAQWQALREVLTRAGLGGSLSERLKTRYGPGVDPQVTLVSRDQVPSDVLSEVLSRLIGRGPASTRYRVQGEVAHGGMGAVLRVWDEDLRRHLAMKVMLGLRLPGSSATVPPGGSKMLTRFLEEAQVTGQLDHPGIVPVHELGFDAEGRVYFTMKLVQGRTLEQVFDELARGVGGWTQARVLGLIQRVCEAMSYAHAKGVIHRDLKPANVMVGEFGEVYVMDWGLAKVLGREDDKDIRIQEQPVPAGSEVKAHAGDPAGGTQDSPLYTMDGDIVGTPAYMPPEQAAGEIGAMGPHSDVYAVGAMLYHLLAGHMPYVEPGARLNNYAVLLSARGGPPEALHEVAAQSPAELVAICERAMAREPERRYPDMAALSEDLSSFVEGRVVSAYETGAWAEAKKWVQRNKPLASSLAAAVGLLVAGLAFSLTQKARADAKTLEAEDNLRLAQRAQAETDEQRRDAEARAEDVLRLSALQDLEDLLAEAEDLWPAHPDRIDGLRSWIARAEALVSELPRHRSKREELRALALPQTARERQLERESHPDFPRLRALRGELSARRTALLQRRDGVEAPLPGVDWSALPEEAQALAAQARPLVDAERTTFGREAEGLVLARRALELAGDDPRLRANLGDTLAWALFALGRDDQALDASAAALDAAPEESREEYAARLAELEAAVGEASSEEGLRAAGEELARLDQELAALEARVEERRDWRFPEEHAEARWWNAQLTKLIEGLEALRDPATGLLSPGGVSPEHGWAITSRLAFAEELEARSAEGGDLATAWAEALPAISEAYPGLDLTPQAGLLPLGPDPDSGLWEFAHQMTGIPAQRAPDGALVRTEETGMVLVLLPGGRFWMGAQSEDPSERNYDPQAQGDEGPVHPVELTAFFLSKYELTQSQWLRLTGSNPSYYQHPGGFASSLLHPVEQVSWQDCMTWLPRAGLMLPSEAQWEYGARAGTDTPWWTGPQRESLRERDAVNLADQAAAQAGATWAEIEDWPELHDGYPVHAPVGTYSANAFGLHDVAGNLWEWCLDGYDEGFYGRSPWVDPVAPWAGAADRVRRGGSFGHAALNARSALRISNTPSNAGNNLGVRPMRLVVE